MAFRRLASTAAFALSFTSSASMSFVAFVSQISFAVFVSSGWGNAMSAVAVAKDVFAQRKIGIDQLPFSPLHSCL